MLASAALVPGMVSRNKKRVLVASFVMANLPDIDAVLLALGAQTYHFHHRGLTHSLLGIFLMLPLLYFVLWAIMGANAWYDEKFRDRHFTKKMWGFALVQLTFSHLFLDYLTSYGMMFLYPLSFQRSSFPLMFIIDPWLWLLTGAGTALVIFAPLTASGMRKGTVVVMLMLIPFWGGEIIMREIAKAGGVQNIVAEEGKKVLVYPLPFAPLHWKVVTYTEKLNEAGKVSFTALEQEKVDFFKNGIFSGSERELMPALDPQKLNTYCFQEEPMLYLKYLAWAELAYCEIKVRAGVKGCWCSPLKFSSPSKQEYTFGSMWFLPEGTGQFVLRF
jgi:membrane-bound metal-dependent hydrolase YbcI (DUF457 family)